MMIKIFVQQNHHELEAQVNQWLSTQTISVLSISYSVCTLNEEIAHSVLINYIPVDSKPC